MLLSHNHANEAVGSAVSDAFSSQANMNRLAIHGHNAAMSAAFTNYWDEIHWQGGRRNINNHFFSHNGHNIPCEELNQYFVQRERTDMTNRMMAFVFTCPVFMWSFGGLTTLIAFARMNPLAMVIGNIIGVSALIMSNIIIPKIFHAPIQFKACLLSSGSMILGTIAGLASCFYVSSIASILAILGVVMVIYSAKFSWHNHHILHLSRLLEADIAERIIQNHPELLQPQQA
jgi:hypothetical protein